MRLFDDGGRSTHRTEPFLANGEIINPDRKAFAGGGLIVGETDRQGLKRGGNFDAFVIARALVLADVGDFLAVDEKLVGLVRVIGVPFQQGPVIGEFLHGGGLRPEFLAPVRRLDVIEPAEVAGGIKQEDGQAHIDQIIGERARAFAIHQRGVNQPAGRHRRGCFDLVVKPAPVFAAECGDLVGGKADEASAFHGGCNLQGMRAAVGHAFLDTDVTGFGEAGRDGACGCRFKIFRYDGAGLGTAGGAARHNNTQHHSRRGE
jgi:hypothetical protein